MKAIRVISFFTISFFAVACAYLWQDNSSLAAEYSPRESSHARQDASGMMEIMRMLKANVETGQLEPGDRAKMLKAVQAYNAPKSQTLAWNQMGPNNQGGRTRAILVVSDTELFVGAVSGGLWKTTDAANNWAQVESFPSLMVSCIARTGNGDIYVGTGSNFDGAGGEGGSGFTGEGLYRSTDNGATWSLVPGTASSLGSPGTWANINELAADVSNPAKVWIAYQGGLATFDGSTGTLIGNVGGGAPTNCHDIQISTDGSVMLLGGSGGIGYRSTNGGVNWTNMSTPGAGNLPAANSRIEFAISPQDPNYAYALIASSGSVLKGGYFTSNGGQSWSLIWPGQQEGYDLFNYFGNPQGFYDNCIIVDPSNKNRAIAGGVTLWECGALTEPQLLAVSFSFPGFPLYVHPDIHSFAWSPNGTLYIGTDGGIFKSTDGAQTFQEANRGYITTQYYNMSHDSYSGIMGGTQDNGTIYVPNNGMMTDDLEGVQITGGDGFACEITQVNQGGIFAGFSTSQYGVVYRIDPQGNGGLISSDEDEGQFYTKIRLYENTNDPLSQQFVTLVNPFDETVTEGETFTLFTQNLNLPFEYTLQPGEELVYFETFTRPEIFAAEPITEDPNFPWLPPQTLTETIIDCTTIETPIDTVQVISEIIFIDSTIFINDIPFTLQIPIDTLYEDVINYEITEECDTTYYYASDVLEDVRGQIQVKDPYTTVLAWGLQGGLGLRITRQGLNFNTTPEWWTLVPNIPNQSSVRDIEFSSDGTTMYYSTWNGKLFRVKDLHLVWSEEDVDLVTIEEIYSTGGAAVTGISIDPNDNDHMVISVGGYGGSNKVLESFNATGSTTFANIWNPGGGLNGMPCYDVLIEMSSSERIIVGTEFGVWMTENGGTNWSEANLGDMDRVPVFELRQQTWGPRQFSYPLNTGVIYAGTHGRGFFNNTGYVGVDETSDGVNAGNGLLVYPNPASDMLNVNIIGQLGDKVTLDVYDIAGKLIKSVNQISASGAEQRVSVPVSELPIGNYVLAARIGAKTEVAKFVVMR